jgi:outer membrane receptor protein involved in Fe transport
MKYEFDDERMLFATVAKGQRMPSSFAQPNFWNRPDLPTAAVNNPQCQQMAQSLGVYDDAINGTKTDKVWSYDLGLKSTWLDRRLQVNTSVYYLEWSDLQRNVQMSQFVGACNILIPANVGEVEIRGLEMELIYLPTEWLRLNAAVGYTDAQVAETVPGVNDSLGQQLEKGDSIENVAPWTASAGIETSFDLGGLNLLLSSDFAGFARIDWRYADERLGTNVGDPASIKADPIRSWFVSEPYDLTDLRVGMRNDDWAVSVYVSNVFNERAMFESFRQAWLPNQRIVSVSQPRTFGVSIKRSF